MGKHRRPSRRVPWRNLRRSYAELVRRYEALEADHCRLVGVVEEARRPRLPRQTSWGALRENLTGLDPALASVLTHRSGLLRSPGGAWSEADRGTTG